MLVIGGPAEARQSLLTLLIKLDIRVLDGTGALSADRAERLADWADVVCLWASGGLDRTVTEHLPAGGRSRTTVIIVNEQTIPTFLDAALTHLPFGNRSAVR